VLEIPFYDSELASTLLSVHSSSLLDLRLFDQLGVFEVEYEFPINCTMTKLYARSVLQISIGGNCISYRVYCYKKDTEKKAYTE